MRRQPQPSFPLRADERADFSSAFFGTTLRRIQRHRVGPCVSCMPELGSSHSLRAVRPAAFPLFENGQWARSPYDIRATRRERSNTRFQGTRVSQHKVEHDLEVTCRYALQRGLKIEVMQTERLIQFIIRPHVTPARHFHECIERYVKRRHAGAILQSLRQAALSRTGRSVQYDRDGCHISRRQR